MRVNLEEQLASWRVFGVKLRLYPEDSGESLNGFKQRNNNQICILERSVQRMDWGLGEGGRLVRKLFK